VVENVIKFSKKQVLSILDVLRDPNASQLPIVKVWIIYTLSYLLFVLSISNIVLSYVIYSITPLNKIEPMLFSISDDSERIVRINKVTQDDDSLNKLLESLARQYVKLKETINHQSESYRWQRISWFSSSELNAKYLKLFGQNSSNNILSEFRDRKIIRNVVILSSMNLSPEAPNTWQIEWRSTDRSMNDEKIVQENTWISTLTATTYSQEVKQENVFKNPIGFIVTHYKTSEK